LLRWRRSSAERMPGACSTLIPERGAAPRTFRPGQ
jgi:hypothetical protein